MKGGRQIKPSMLFLFDLDLKSSTWLLEGLSTEVLDYLRAGDPSQAGLWWPVPVIQAANFSDSIARPGGSVVGGLLAEYFELLILGMDSEEIVAKAAEGAEVAPGSGDNTETFFVGCDSLYPRGRGDETETDFVRAGAGDAGDAGCSGRGR
ncbi:MAG: hypothetical protein PHN90_10510 [Methanothrix sp.]|jgi:hypothetical protein|nr:hypothetical protein [Methanothrix sp.]